MASLQSSHNDLDDTLEFTTWLARHLLSPEQQPSPTFFSSRGRRVHLRPARVAILLSRPRALNFLTRSVYDKHQQHVIQLISSGAINERIRSDGLDDRVRTRRDPPILA